MDMVHVAFYNDGRVMKISECPEGISLQSWFNHLSRTTRDRYESLSGGRGVFRFEEGELGRLKDEAGAKTT